MIKPETLSAEETKETHAPLESELEEYQRQLEAIKQEARSLIEGLTDEQFNWHPAPGVWSIADNLAHLNVTGQLYLSRIDASIEEARSKELFGAGPFRHSFLGNWFLRLLEPPVKRKFKAPKIFVPMPDQPLARVAPEFISLQDEVLERLHRANGLNLARARVASPISRFLRLSLGQSFLLITSHERRHLWQAAQVKAAQGFPV